MPASACHLVTGLAWILVLLLIAPPPALAYLDPGTSSYMMQMMIGGLLGVAATARFYWEQNMVRLKKTLVNGFERGIVE